MSTKKWTALLIILILIVICIFVVENFVLRHDSTESIRVGYFPNITHSPALVGIATNKFQEAFDNKIKIETRIFNAGPSEIEALFAGEIDIGYIGPSPAINGYIKSNGQALHIVSGTNSGGASLVLQHDLANQFATIGSDALIGKKIATPQQGNTQDISLRHYLKENLIFDKVNIIPIANADQFTMFSQKNIDGAWAPEPWASRLVVEANGKRVFDERTKWPNNQFCTTNIIVSTKFLNEHREIVKQWLKTNSEVIKWIKENPTQAKEIINNEIERLTTKKLSQAVVDEAWAMLDVTSDPLTESVFTFADWAFEQGFLGENKPDLANLYDLSIYNEIGN